MVDLSKTFEKSNTDYSKVSIGRSFNFNGYYISPNRLVKGNSKLYNILIFDLPAVETCLNCNDCKTKCYALKAQRQYTDTRIFRSTNLALFNDSAIQLKYLIVNQLNSTKITTVRIHSSGDFFNQEYINFWEGIVYQFPNIKFYAYTKVAELLDFSKIESLPNFNLISSFVGEYQLNFGSLQYCEMLHTNHDTFICPATKSSDIKFRCGLNCNYCVTKKNVCFVIH